MYQTTTIPQIPIKRTKTGKCRTKTRATLLYEVNRLRNQVEYAFITIKRIPRRKSCSRKNKFTNKKKIKKLKKVFYNIYKSIQIMKEKNDNKFF